MAKPFERMRLKDKIVEDLSKAIKSIQEKMYYMSKDPAISGNLNSRPITLSNGDRLCHKLCDKLDHAFLHGLKEVTHGYWKLVKMLSHKGMVREIDFLTNVTTDLGRGRAWLYASLNEGLLESYFRMLGENEKLVKKHYNKEALVMDRDRMHVLLTLMSGLDCVIFQLEYDLPYLDLSPSPPRTQTGGMDEDVSSTDRRVSVQSDICPRPHSDSDSVSICSFDVQPMGDARGSRYRTTVHAVSPVLVMSDNGDAKESMVSSGLGLKSSSRAITPTEVFHSNNSRTQTPSDTQSLSSFGSVCDLDRHQRFESIVSVDKDAVDDAADDSLEVIRVINKKKKKKPKPAGTNTNIVHKEISKSSSTSIQEEKKKKSSETISQNSTSLATSSIFQTRSLDKTVSETAKEKEVSTQSAANSRFNSGPDINDIIADSAMVNENSEHVNNISCDSKKTEVANSHNSTPTEKESDTLPVVNSIKEQSKMSSLSVIESKIAEMCSDKSKDEGIKLLGPGVITVHKPKDAKKTEFDLIGIDGSVDSVRKAGTNVTVKDGDCDGSSTQSSRTSQDEGKKPGMSNNDTGESAASVRREMGSPSPYGTDSPLPEGDAEDYFDVYTSGLSPTQQRDDRKAPLTKLQETSYLQDYMDCVLKGSETPSKDMVDAQKEAGPKDYSLSLDNNTKLQIMLEIFQQEDETFVKMFACIENHTEGHFSVAFVLISDQYLYLLHYQAKYKKFTIQSVTRLTDIIFISTGLYEQTLNIESRDKSKQKQRLWLTPGHQDLTKAIVQSLTEVVKQANAAIVSVRTRFSVGSDVPLQKIGLRKYISRELHCEAQDVAINDYSLVFWEDPSSIKSAYSTPKAKEGTLLLRTQDPVKGFVWKPVYMMLKGAMLSISNSKSDPRPHTYMGLGGDQCIGCRLTEVGERQHCVELVLAQGGSWYLSTATEGEILDWRRALCLAVSQGVEELGALSACVPCCCVQACNQLIMCHEDLDTKFFRTLGRAQMEDVTGVSVDSNGTPYCVVEFESQEIGVVSGKWVFHFASSVDMNRFTSSLSAGWRDIFQVDLPISVLEDVTLQRHCRSYTTLLSKAFELK